MIDPRDLTKPEAVALFQRYLGVVALLPRIRDVVERAGNDDLLDSIDSALTDASCTLDGNLVIEQQKSGSWFVTTAERPG